MLRRVPWWAVGVTALVLLTAPFAVDPIRDAATHGAVGDGHLDVGAAYLLIGPISDVLDTLTLLTVGQHIAVLVSSIVLFAVARATTYRGGAGSLRREAVASAAFLVALVAAYAVMALVPRPMARFVPSDDTVLAADFHSHTQYSHDGRKGWSEDDVRDWHRGGGYDVAYITDHATYEGAERGIASNPPFAGEGTMLLQGIEAIYHGERVNILSAGRRYRGLTTPDLKNVDEQSLMLASMLVATRPVLIETVPGKLDSVPHFAGSEGGVSAIEIVDGSPRGLSQTRRERARIVRLADSLNLALVAGSDNHGWGRTAPGWTLLRVPGWRGMTTDSLSRRIEEILRVGGRAGTLVVERRVADANDALSLVLSLPLVIWRMFTVLGADERVMWLLWTWAVLFATRAVRRRRTGGTSTTAAA